MGRPGQWLIRLLVLTSASLLLLLYVTWSRGSITHTTLVDWQISIGQKVHDSRRLLDSDTERIDSVCVPTLTKASTDRYKAMPPHCFNYTINNPKICADAPDLFILIYVYSAPADIALRQTIRETWGDKRLFGGKQVRIVFPVGATDNVTVQHDVIKESERTGDIVQQNYLDSYKNLSYKGIHILKWVHQFCPHARYILKVDTDVFVNIFNLYALLRHGFEANDRFFGCRVYMSPVLRPGTWCWKWCVTKDEYRDSVYPRYCFGSAFFMSGKTAHALYHASLTTPIWWIDDVFITGLLARNAGAVRHRNINLYFVEETHQIVPRIVMEPRGVLFGMVKNSSDVHNSWTVLVKKWHRS